MNFEPTAGTNQKQAVTYYGSYTRKVDVKGRFHLPFQFRGAKTEATDDGIPPEEYMICPGPQGSWALAPMAIWVASFNKRPVAQDEAQDEEPDKGKALENRRQMSKSSFTTIPDKQGRIAIPPRVKGAMGVDREILIVGMGATMELWMPETVDGDEAAVQLPSEDYLIEFFG